MDFSRLTDPQAYKDALAGLLRRGTEVGDYIQEAPTKVGQSIMDAGQRQSALMNKAFDPTGNTLIRDPQAANQAAMNLFEGPMAFAPAGITAFHGTPHLIKDKFDISKVGTGEGAQAYGHGMYFAENPAVAKGYADMDTQMAKTFLATNNDDIFKAINDAEKQYDFVKQNFAPSPQTIERNKRTLDYLNNKMLKNQDIAGNLYKVDIPDAYIPKMLDYDKPLKDQPQIIDLLKQSKNKDVIKMLSNLDSFAGSNASPTGQNLLKTLGYYPDSPEKASKTLNALGITGVRYLDEGSRSMPFKVQVFDNNKKLYTENLFPTKDQANIYMEQYKSQGYAPKFSEVDKKRTSNFVVFDPTDVKILERNNQPISRKELLQEQIDKIAK